ncbi:hypothetical protein E3C22_10075 [Jiella endophytica]|uniref:Uncharacterized protein n=1 Tax=Jiella endophytica TaxID=2558362 RepID=A0A4Y8RK34_9HYPH|nr:hypothetical protein [Jiella endophytica]TFF22806.1 hypothetical protein E3C22_10075 [Jiella endophytica]
MRLLILFMLVIFGTPALAACEDAGPAASFIKQHWLSQMGSERRTCIFYGDYSGDGAADAVAFYYYEKPQHGRYQKPGEGVVLEAALFRREGGGYRFDGSADIGGENPRNVTFGDRKIMVDTTVAWRDPGIDRTWTVRAPN